VVLVMLTKDIHDFFFFFFTAGSFADQIGPTNEDVNVVRKETENVTLKCSYESSSEFIWLHWYKQYPNRSPQFLLFRGARSYRSASTPNDTRLQMQTTRNSNELTIRGLKLSDSALFYCSLAITA
ncbi:hypothetical protein C0J45_23902, partial [Silurus meridionalis]